MPTVTSAHHPLWYAVGHVALAGLGLGCTLVGVALCSTFWLLPIGLPLALLGIALMEAAGEAH